MPVGGQVTFTAFDGSKKCDWLIADIHGLPYTCAAMTVIGLLFVGLVHGVTGINLLAPFVVIDERWGSDWMIGAVLAAILIPSFVLVFMLRRNLTVMGPRRQFRYICRWL